ncbi:hypothetical protein BDV96DRAFT_260004 [Lophiotrema nucula]|uniref:Uncharacterized protein n=1 Tax=Lophiotrema nucula TaxID=690887 RepID=A0A6A5YMV9_9PLEO|nr:hypothetical protein BDV96DRAFT_260004 [Lophiotrema nucula]
MQLPRLFPALLWIDCCIVTRKRQHQTTTGVKYVNLLSKWDPDCSVASYGSLLAALLISFPLRDVESISTPRTQLVPARDFRHSYWYLSGYFDLRDAHPSQKDDSIQSVGTQALHFHSAWLNQYLRACTMSGWPRSAKATALFASRCGDVHHTYSTRRALSRSSRVSQPP